MMTVADALEDVLNRVTASPKNPLDTIRAACSVEGDDFNWFEYNNLYDAVYNAIAATCPENNIYHIFKGDAASYVKKAIREANPPAGDVMVVTSINAKNDLNILVSTTGLVKFVGQSCIPNVMCSQVKRHSFNKRGEWMMSEWIIHLAKGVALVKLDSNSDAYDWLSAWWEFREQSRFWAIDFDTFKRGWSIIDPEAAFNYNETEERIGNILKADGRAGMADLLKRLSERTSP